jgi:hypothetical protein
MMTRRRFSQAGKLLFLGTFFLLVVSYGGLLFGFFPGIIILGMFLLSFLLMALGSREGDQQ